MKKICLMLTLLTGFSAHGFFEKNEIGRAHEQFTKGNFTQMSTHIRNALMAEPENKALLENAKELLNKSFELKKGQQYPIDWELPSEFDYFRVNHEYRVDFEYDAHRYKLSIGAGVPAFNLISQLQVIRYPSEVVLDKKAGIGEYEETQDDKHVHIHMGAPSTPKPSPEGLYLINIDLSNGKSVKGWFLLTDMTASTVPEILTPHVGQAFTSDQPEFRWKDYFSPEYKSYERRTISASVVTPEDWKSYWEIWQRNPTITEARVGQKFEWSDGKERLERGKNYKLSFSYLESRKFGDLELCRRARSMVPFSVK